MPHLKIDPITRELSFRDPSTAVINRTTGQTADTLRPNVLRREGGVFTRTPKTPDLFTDVTAKILLANTDAQNQALANADPERFDRLADKAGFTSTSAITSQQLGRAGQADKFNLALLSILKNAQGVNSVELLKRRRALQRASIGRASEITPEELRTLSPSQQAAIRGADVRALEPELDKISADIARANQLSDTFFKRFELATTLGENFAAKLVPDDETLQGFKKLVEAGEMSLAAVAKLSNEATARRLVELVDVAEIEKNKLRQAKALSEAKKTGTLGDLNPAQQNASFKLADDFEAASKDFFKIRDAFNRVRASAQDPSAAGDLSLIFNFMKTLDPGSVVRESEFATAANTAGVPERIRALYNKVLTGKRLSEATRADFVKRASTLVEAAARQQESVSETFSSRAEAFGIPASFVVRDTGAEGQAPQTFIIGGQETTAGDIITNNSGQRARVLPDGRVEALE